MHIHLYKVFSIYLFLPYTLLRSGKKRSSEFLMPAARPARTGGPEKRYLKGLYEVKRKILAIVLAGAAACSLAACGTGSEGAVFSAAAASEISSSVKEGTDMKQSEEQESAKRTASQGALMQTEDKAVATRVPPEHGTKIRIRFGDSAVINGVLNDSETAQALIKKLPYTVRMSRYSHDFCGITEELPYKETEVHYGWLNGDIDYAADAPYFTILFKDEENSEQYGCQVNIGVITSPIADIDALHGSYKVTVELAE
jgi:hypothetical protein